MPAFLSPKVTSLVDLDWGRSVISLVNNRLNLTMNYLPETAAEDLVASATPTTPDRVDNNQLKTPRRSRIVISSQKNQPSQPKPIDLELRPRQQSSMLKRRDEYNMRGGTHICLIPQSPKEATWSDRDPFNTCGMDREDLFSHGPTGMYSRSQPSAHSLRMPDFLKRVFAPPNCLTPATSSPERLVAPYSHQRTAKTERRERRILTEAVFGPLNGTAAQHIEPRAMTLPVSRMKKKSRAPLPLTSLFGRESTHSEPQTGARNWSGAEHLGAACENLHVDKGTVPGDLTDSPSFVCRSEAERGYQSGEHLDLDLATPDSLRSQSLYASVPMPELEDRTSERPTAILDDSVHSSASDAARLREIQMEKDIEHFLSSAPPLNPLSASQINQLCEQAENVDDMARILEGIDNAELLQDSHKGTSNLGFFPRKTIGKLKRSVNRKTLSVESDSALGYHSNSDTACESVVDVGLRP